MRRGINGKKKLNNTSKLAFQAINLVNFTLEIIKNTISIF